MLLESITRSPALRVVLIGALIVLLQIPVLFIYNLMSEREQSKNAAVAEITDGWGLAQEIVGPYLVVPFRTPQVSLNQGESVVIWRSQTANFLPDDLTINGELAGQLLHRGIYDAAVYSVDVQVTGVFARPDVAKELDPEAIVEWDKARLMVEISDARGFRDAVEVDWSGTVLAFEPGERILPGNRQALQALFSEGDLEGDEFPFSMNFAINGSSSLRFAPLGRRTVTRLTGDWPSPSFQGAWLPDERDVAQTAFSASWTIPFLGRSFPQSWTGPLTSTTFIPQFGVDLLTPIDAYRQTERSLKYELLFLLLTFAPLWLFEVLAGIRLHFIQYGLIGSAVCLFYLLELSLAEHIGFVGAYGFAATMIASLVTSYAWSVLGSVSRAASMGAVISGLYAFLYVLISLEDLALLVGSLALFVVLAVLMYATRRVNWFNISPANGFKPSE